MCKIKSFKLHTLFPSRRIFQLLPSLTYYPKHGRPSEIVQNKRAHRSRQQSAQRRAGRQQTEETGALHGAQVLAGQTDHAGEMDALTGPVQYPHGDDERNRICPGFRSHQQDIRHQKCDQRPDDGRKVNHSLSAEFVAEITTEDLERENSVGLATYILDN